MPAAISTTDDGIGRRGKSPSSSGTATATDHDEQDVVEGDVTRVHRPESTCAAAAYD